MTRTIYYLVVTFTTITFLGCKDNTTPNPNTVQDPADQRVAISKTQFNKNRMSLGSLEEKLFSKTIKVNGMIDVPPENKAVVNAIVGGYIKTIPLLVGDVVKKGQALVTIENPEFVQIQQEYLEIKEQLNYLKSEYERQSTMFKEDIISKKTFLKAESQYKSANATYNGLKKQLSMLNINPVRVEQGQITSVVSIYAPISGSVTKVNVSKGSYVSPTTSILEIINNEHIHIELSVFEKDILKIKKGQNIRFTIPESSDDIHEAKVYLVGTAIEDNRTIKVHGHPLDESQRFLTGMFVNAEIEVDSKSSIALPDKAIIEFDDNHYVLILDEATESSYYFKQLKVDIGSSTNGYTEIKNDRLSKDGKVVLIDGAFGLIGNE